ncbi:MAG: hypothetical protein RL186_263 [Pseudomonadota bacterium]|jgi:hypothetical protein
MMDDVKLHAKGTIRWDASDEILNWFRDNLKPGMRTIETGAGKSTLMFMEAGCIHDAVTPSQSEVDAIQAEAARRGFKAENVTFHVNFSQYVLPHLSGTEDIDVAFIDGGHGFPIPCVDWMYIAPRIKVGGTLLVDDVDLWTGSMLIDVLRREAGWNVERIVRGRTAIVTKTAPFQAREWVNQPTVVAKSYIPQTLRKIRNGLPLLFKMDLAGIARKLQNERALALKAKED